tara:strand:+ start:4188 stop:4415 length:228 start_codon:yes stop_codon:yes gene_type:complete
MLKKEIISKLKTIPDNITTIEDIVDYIFEKEPELQKPTYTSFRSIKLKEMYDNPITYKEKLAIISEEWKKLKETF